MFCDLLLLLLSYQVRLVGIVDCGLVSGVICGMRLFVVLDLFLFCQSPLHNATSLTSDDVFDRHVNSYIFHWINCSYCASRYLSQLGNLSVCLLRVMKPLHAVC